MSLDGITKHEFDGTTVSVTTIEPDQFYFTVVSNPESWTIMSCSSIGQPMFSIKDDYEPIPDGYFP